MTTETERLAKALLLQARQSSLPPADQARALVMLRDQLQMQASEDPVTRLANEMMSWAMTMGKPAHGDELRTFYYAMSLDVDIAAIELEGAISDDGRIARKARNSIAEGKPYDIGGISSVTAKAFIESVIEEIGQLDTPEEKLAAAIALTTSMNDAPRTTLVGHDEMLMGVVRTLGYDPNALGSETGKRMIAIYREMFAG